MDSTLQTIRPELLTLSAEQLRALAPYFWVFGGTVLAILGCVLRVVKPKWPVFLLTLATATAGICTSAELLHHDSIVLFNGMMVSDSYSNFFNILFMASVILT